jgi:hypothetical protein
MTDQTEESGPRTVYVVASRPDGAPHPYVEAVYDSEEAAEEHRQHLADNSFEEGVVAWGVHERTIESSFETEVEASA